MTATAFRARYGPWALVAGASEGLGACFVREAARRGLNVVLAARRRPLLESLAAEVERAHGIETRVVELDLARADLIEATRDAIAGLDVGLLVYNAMYSQIGPFLEQPLEDALMTLDVNCRGPLVLVHELGRAMVARGRGGIVLMSSMAGFQGSALVGTYAASKAFDTILAESLWFELEKHGVDVMACCAGMTATPNFHATKPRKTSGPVMEPEAVAREALDRLGSGPSAIAGRGNRAAAFFLHRFLPRRVSIRVMGRALEQMYGKG